MTILSITKTTDELTIEERLRPLYARRDACAARLAESAARLQERIAAKDNMHRLVGDPAAARHVAREIRDIEAAKKRHEDELAAIAAEAEPLEREQRRREIARAVIAKRAAMERLAVALREAAKASRELQDVADLLSSAPGCPTFWPELDTRGGGRLAGWLKLFETCDFESYRKVAQGH